MNKSLALEWLVENVTKWPTASRGIKSSPDGWSWGESPNQDIWLFTDTPSQFYVDCYIKQSEWLDGSSNEPMSRSDAFDWVYNKFSKCIPTDNPKIKKIRIIHLYELMSFVDFRY